MEAPHNNCQSGVGTRDLRFFKQASLTCIFRHNWDFMFDIFSLLCLFKEVLQLTGLFKQELAVQVSFEILGGGGVDGGGGRFTPSPPVNHARQLKARCPCLHGYKSVWTCRDRDRVRITPGYVPVCVGKRPLNGFISQSQ